MNFTVERAAITMMLRTLTSNRANALAYTVAEWRQLTNKQRQKRTAKGKRPAWESIEAKHGTVVQRMSSEITGRQQK